MIGLILNIFIYFYYKTLDKKNKKIIFLGIAFAMGILAFSYYRIDNSGDVTRYLLQYKNMSTEKFIIDEYNKNYLLWYLFIYNLKKYNLNFQILNFICIFIIYYINLFVVLEQNLEEKYEKKLVLKTLLYYSFALLFSSYRGTLCFSLAMLGIFFLIKDIKIKGYIFFILSILIHPIGYAIIIIYFLSLFINISVIKKRLILLFSLLLGFLNKNIIIFISKLLLSKNKFYSEKIDTYLIGNWSKYNFENRGEVLSYLIIFILYSFIIIYFLKSKAWEQMNKKYINFIFLYLVISLNFITFRTIFYRLSHDGFLFFLPLFSCYLKEEKKKKISYIILVVFWCLLIDYRNILYILGFYKETFYIDMDFLIPYKYLKNIYMHF